MTNLHAAVLGLIQGLGECLPISSSAHLVVIPRLLGWPDQGLSVDVALHWGTLAALLLYFWKDWVRLISAGLMSPQSPERRLLLLIVVATVPGGIAGLLFNRYIEETFRNPALIALTLMLFGVVLGLADWKGKKSLAIEALGWGPALWIGAAQALAIVPGVSRSGITMTAALILGFKREDAARFSFLLSVPIVLAAGALKLRHLHGAALGGPFWVGIAVSAGSGAIAIWALMGWVRKRSLAPFVVYRLIAGLALLALSGA